MPTPDESCEAYAPSGIYRDWKSVAVRCEYRVPERSFQLHVVELGPLGEGFSKLRLIPGDKVKVYLAGEEAIGGGVIFTRLSMPGDMACRSTASRAGTISWSAR